jgi:predicted Zn-dependent peptidase
VIREVLAQVASDGITDDECARAKGSLRGGLVLGLEDTGSRMNRIGRSELNYANHRDISDTLSRIDQVTVEEVRDVARVLLTRQFGAAVVGPYKNARQLPASVKSIVG